MGFMDKMKSAVDDKMVEQQEKKLAKVEDKNEQKELASVFKPTKTLGDLSIDTANGLFKVRHATASMPKRSGAMMKTGKAFAAVTTLGASVALEHAMKPDDKIFRFEELRSYELLEDDSEVSGGGVGRAVVGGVLFGGVGAVVGGMTGKKKSKKVVETLVLKINLNDLDFPCIMVPYINKSMKTTDNNYKKAYGAAQESISCLELIIDIMNKQQTAVPAQQQQQAQDDPVEQVKKLKELMDAGILSGEEFEAKKKQLLGL